MRKNKKQVLCFVPKFTLATLAGEANRAAIHRFETARVQSQFPRSFLSFAHNFRTQWRFGHLFAERSRKAN